MTAALSTAHGSAPSPLLTVSGLTVTFGPVRALTAVNLAMFPGDLVAVAGEPGAGKTTLVRCIAGDVAPNSGGVALGDRTVPAAPLAAGRQGIAVVWQDLALCDSLDVAGNVLLGQETPRLLRSESRFHATAAKVLESLEIPIRDTRRLVGSLSGGDRQLVALAQAIGRAPRLLLLDEPTASLGVVETAHVETLISRLRAQGTTILLVSRDSEQMFRMADRIAVLRQGRLVAELDPSDTHPDDLTALLSGQQVDSSARRQLTRLHGLADRLVSADPSSSLSLILAALGAALGTEKVCIHVTNGQMLHCATSLGFAPEEISTWSGLPFGPAGGPVGRAAMAGERIIEEDLGTSRAWAVIGGPEASATIASSWSVPVIGPDGVSAVITAFRPDPGAPLRDELDLLTLYVGYVASAVERDRLLDQVTARNRVLETIREMLETLAGPVAVAQGLTIALQSLRRGLQADEVALLTPPRNLGAGWRAYAGPLGTDPVTMSSGLTTASLRSADEDRLDGTARAVAGSPGGRVLAVPFMGPGGPTVLLAAWNEGRPHQQETALIEDAAHSLRLALEREEAGLAHQEAAALRRSRELQRGFLSRLSHELRTPLTAIRGYASSLMQPDVTWDGASQARFLDRIAAESARLGRLVDDLLDFSAIESGVMRLQHDWCDIHLVVDAAVSCLPHEHSAAVTVACDIELPAVWADHDRLEQVFVNLLNNAFRHNPPGTRVRVTARALTGLAERRRGAAPGVGLEATEVEISVVDDGPGFPAALASAPFDSAARRRSRSAGAGLGLSIARGIVHAHGGSIVLAPASPGTAFCIRLPVEGGQLDGGASDSRDPADPGELTGLHTGSRVIEPMSRSAGDA